MRVINQARTYGYVGAESHVIEISDPDDARDGLHFLHRVTHPMEWVSVQVWGVHGNNLPLPGVGHAMNQTNPGVVYLPVLEKSHYPLMVVMIG